MTAAVHGYGPGQHPPGIFEVEGEVLATLPDLVGPGMRLLFVGYNPSIRSARVGHYYAGRNNAFWRLLSQSGLVLRPMSFSEDGELPALGIGITDLVKRPTRSAAEPSRAEYRTGVARLRSIIETFRPGVVCYNGKGVYLLAAGCAAAPWGVQATSLIAGVVDYVSPSPSGLARLPFGEKLGHYAALRTLLEEME